MMNKYLRVTMGDGSKWDIPAIIIAKDRARYYAEKDAGINTGKEFSRIYQEEIKNCLTDNYFEILDWAANNMNWEDVKDDAEKVSSLEVNFQEGWINGEKEVITK